MPQGAAAVALGLVEFADPSVRGVLLADGMPLTDIIRLLCETESISVPVGACAIRAGNDDAHEAPRAVQAHASAREVLSSASPPIPRRTMRRVYQGGATRVRTRPVASCRSATAMNGGSTSTLELCSVSMTPSTNADETCPGLR